MWHRVTAYLLAFYGGLTLPSGAEELGDSTRGAALFRQCAACHDIGEGARNRVGPSLNHLYGRKVGGEPGFNYSSEMRSMGEDGLVWTQDMLDRYLENPRAFASNTRMAFAGLQEVQDRADVLAYIREASPLSGGGESPEMELDAEILAIEGDPDYGEYLSAECLTCHKLSGDSEGIPSITHWPERDFVLAMHAYKTKVRSHPVMEMIAGRLGDEEIAALAAYFAKIE